MGFEDLPDDIEQDIRRFADEQHLTRDEAVIRLLESGLVATKTKNKFGIPGLPSEPMSDEDAAVMDQIVDDAMRARRERLERLASA